MLQLARGSGKFLIRNGFRSAVLGADRRRRSTGTEAQQRFDLLLRNRELSVLRGTASFVVSFNANRYRNVAGDFVDRFAAVVGFGQIRHAVQSGPISRGRSFKWYGVTAVEQREGASQSI